MPKPPALLHFLYVLRLWHLLLLAVAALLPVTLAHAKPVPRSEPANTLYGFIIPAAGCAPTAKPSADAKLCAQRDEPACERLALATVHQPDRTQDCAVWRALGKGFGSGEAVQSERLLRALLGLIDRQVGGAADQALVPAAQAQVRKELLRQSVLPPGSELARGLRRDLAVLGLLRSPPDRQVCREAAAYLAGHPRDEKQPVVEGFVPSPLGVLGPLGSPRWTQLLQAATGNWNDGLQAECGLVLSDLATELLQLGDWDGDGLDDLLVPTPQNQALRKGFWEAWLADGARQVEVVEAAVARLCPQKDPDGLRCYRAAELGQWLVAQAPLAAEAERRQWGVIRALQATARESAVYEVRLANDPEDDLVRARLGLVLETIRRVPDQIEKYLTLFAESGPWMSWRKRELADVAPVKARLRELRWQLALERHASGQRLKAEGKFEEAFLDYGRAAAAYEVVLAQDPTGPDAYKIAWTLAECWYWAGVQCTAARNSDGELIVVEGQLAPTPPEQVPLLHKACESMERSIAWYRRVRDWTGVHSKDNRGHMMDKTEEAAWSSLEAYERMLSARASLPKADPQYLDVLGLPTIRPWAEVDREDVVAAEGLKEVRRVTPKPVPAAAVEWLLEADAYVEMAATHTPAEDPRRAEKLSLKAAELLYKLRHFDPWPEGASKRTPAEFWSARVRLRRILQRFPRSAVAKEAVKWLHTSRSMEHDEAPFSEAERELEPSPEPPKGRCFGKCWCVVEREEALFADAVANETAAKSERDSDRRRAAINKARAEFVLAGDAFVELRHDTDKASTKAQALRAGVTAYYRAQAWDKAFASLDLAEQILRDALRDPKFAAAPTPLPRRATKDQRAQAQQAQARLQDERRELVKGLTEVLEIRADLRYKLFDIPATIRDYLALYENDPRGDRAAYYLQAASQLAMYQGDSSNAIAIQQRLVRDFANTSTQTKVLENARLGLTNLYRRAHDPAGELAALATYVTSYERDNSAATRVLRALARTAELQSKLGQTVAATATRRKILARFAAIADSDKTRPAVAPIAAQAALDLLQPQLQAFLATKPEPGQLPKRQADLAALITATRAVDSYGALSIQAQTAVVRSQLRRHLALQVPAATPDLAASLQADAIADLNEQLRSHPRHAELRRELRYYQPDLAPPAGVGVLAEYDLPGTLPLAIELPAPASDSAVASAFNQALADYRDWHLEQAIAAARTAVKLDANHSRSKVLLSTLQLRSGDPAGALATLDAGLAARPSDVMLMAQKIQVLGAAGKLGEAVKLADAALRLDHSNPEVMWSLGQAYRRAGRDGLARLAYERAMAVYLEDLPRSDDDNRRPVRQYDDRKLRSFGTLQGVDAEALPHDAGLAQIHAAYAQLALRDPSPDPDTARTKFEKALTYRPNYADFYANLGAALLTAGDPAALEPLQKALEGRHNDPRLLNNLALAQRLVSKPDQARATLLQARRLDPKLPEPLYNLALLQLDTLRDAAGLAKIRELLAQFKQLRGSMPADQPDPADALLAEAEALLAWRQAITR